MIHWISIDQTLPHLQFHRSDSLQAWLSLLYSTQYKALQKQTPARNLIDGPSNYSMYHRPLNPFNMSEPKWHLFVFG